MTALVYPAVLVLSCAGMLVVDHRWKVAWFDRPSATALGIASCMTLLLTWDVLGVRSGVFFRGATDYMTGLTVAPEIPVEEIVFLYFLSHLALVCALVGARIGQRRTGERR